MVKILHPIPKTWPSFLYSMAGAATELAKPVIGTKAPAPPFCQFRINSGSRQNDTDQDEKHGSPVAAVILGKFLQFAEVENNLTENADSPSCEKSPEHIQPEIVAWRLLIYISFILLLSFHLFCRIHNNTPFLKVIPQVS